MAADSLLPLDATDTKIVHALLRDGRESVSAIAKRAHISKQACLYRMRRLERVGIVKGYTTRIDSAKLGFSTFAVYVRLIDVDRVAEDALVVRITSLPEVRWLVRCTGMWDLMLAVGARSNAEFHTLLKLLLGVLGTNAADYETATILSTQDIWLRHPEEFAKELPESGAQSPLVLDRVDQRIISLLQDDARIECTRMASVVKLTPEAIAYRMRSLRKSGIIHSSHAVLDKERLGLTWYQVQFVLRDVDDAREKGILGKIRAIEGAGYIVRTLGKWNFEVHLYCRDAVEFRDRLFDIRQLLGTHMRSMGISIILGKNVSRTYIPD